MPAARMKYQIVSRRIGQLQSLVAVSHHQSLLRPIAGHLRPYSEYSPFAQETKAHDGFVPQAQPREKVAKQTGMERLSTSSLLRNILLGTMFTSPILFKIGMTILQRIANSESRLLNPDANPFLRAIVKPIAYDQFCAGTEQLEIYNTRDEIRRMGYSGVILCYGREVQVAKDNQMKSTGNADNDMVHDINWFKDGNLKTLDMVGEGDWLGIKFTGAGSAVTQALMKNESPPPEFIEAMDAICQKTLVQNCRLWIDSEQQIVQKAIDSWTVDLMRKYNRNGNVVVYNTLQAYLKESRVKLQQQLALANAEGWTLAIKLVRGAYIANDQRELIHDTKNDTDVSYDGIIKDLLAGTNFGIEPNKFPNMKLFLAGHNPESITKAWSLIQQLSAEGRLKVLPDFGQLQGMADHLGCGILQRCEDARTLTDSTKQTVVVPKVYKCLTWGSIQECMQYLLRRLVENRGGADRMRDGLSLYWAELRRRTIRTRS